MYRLAALLFLGLQFFSPVAQSSPHSDCLEAVAYLIDLGGQKKIEVVKKYKNDDRFAAWIHSRGLQKALLEEDMNRWLVGISGIYNSQFLDPTEVKEIWSRLPAHPFAYLIWQYDNNQEPIEGKVIPKRVWLKNFLRDRESPDFEYALAVASLRQGDLVQFSDRFFRLGEFLGYQNSSQVFALKHHPKLAIKIPFPILRHREADRREDYYIKKTLSAVPLFQKGRVLIRKKSPRNEYLIVDRVFGDLNGEDFLTDLLFTYSEVTYALNGVFEMSEIDNPTELLQLKAEALDQSHVIEDKQKRVMFEKLVRIIHKQGYQPAQYVWSVPTESWVLVDWD